MVGSTLGAPCLADASFLVFVVTFRFDDLGDSLSSCMSAAVYSVDCDAVFQACIKLFPSPYVELGANHDDRPKRT